METVGKTFKKQSFRNVITYILVYCMVMNTSLPAVLATPSGGAFTVGTGTIVQDVVGGDNTVLVDQLESVIQWGSTGLGGIDTSPSESLSFSQAEGLSNSAVLNRIMSGNLTQFDGALNGLGMRIFIVNPAGIVFGEGSTVNVAQLVASGLDMSNSAFHDVLENVNNKMVFSGGAGDVTNNGTINATNSAYLVGVNVTNTGSISCPGGLVVMAAGDTVQLGQPGSSVIVDLADFTFSTNNLNTSGAVEAQHIVLGAGDIWASALTASGVGAASIVAKANNNVVINGSISAEATAASPAVATIDIEAGGDVTVEDETTVQAKAIGQADTADAAITINAGGDIYLKDGGVEALALTEDGSGSGAGNLTALVDIDAGEDLNVGDGEYIGFVLAVAKTGEGAYGTYGNITSTVDIDAGTVSVNRGNINAIAKTGTYSQVNAGDITATVEIDAVGYEGDGHVSGDIYVGDYATGALYNAEVSAIEAHAEAGSGITGTAGNVTAIVNLDASGMLDVDDGGVQADARVGYESTPANAGDLTAMVDIVTGDSVDIQNGYIEAIAGPIDESPATIGDTSATVDIISGGDVDVYAGDAYAGISAEAFGGVNNSADVTVDADGDVILESEEGTARIYAWAHDGSLTNSADVEINAGGDVEAVGLFGGEAEIEADTWSGTDNISNINITANDGRVYVGGGMEGTAVIGADAYDGVNNTANVTVTAKQVESEDEDAGSVIVEAGLGGRAGIDAVAVGAENSNSADVTVNADEDVEVEAYESGDAWIEAIASNDDESNTANITIDAGGNVDVRAEHNSYAKIYAEASAGYDNTAAVDVTANDGNVDVYANDYGYASIESNAMWVTNNNDADVTVTAKRTDPEDYESGNVNVTAESYSKAWIDTETYEAGNSNTSTTTINADGNVLVKALGSLNGASIGAYANLDDETNTANVIVTAGGDVEVDNDGMANAYIEAIAEYGVTNTAGVDITANDGHVLVDSYDGGARIAAYAYYGVDNTANVTVTAKGQNGEKDDNGDVIVYAEGEAGAWIGAYAVGAENSNTATTTVNADENVVVEAYDGGRAGIKADADNDDETNTANVYITAGGNVDVKAQSATAEISAEAYWGGINTAGVDITTTDGNVDVYASEGSYAGIKSNAFGAENNNTADVTVTAKRTDPEDYKSGNVYVTSQYGSDAWIDTETYSAGNSNTSTTTVNADGDVSVYASNGLEASIGAYAGYDDESNTANVIVTAGGDVDVDNDGMANAYIEAEAEYGVTNTAGVVITANNGHIEVDSFAGEAKIAASARYGVDNTATVTVTAKGQNDVEDDNGDVIVEAEGAGAWIGAYAEYAENSNTATTTVNADENVYVEASDYGWAGIKAQADNDDETNTANVYITAGGNVEAVAGDEGDVDISAEAYYGVINTAGVEINAEHVAVSAEFGSSSEIKAQAQWAYGDEGSENTAEVAIYTHAADVEPDEQSGDVLVEAAMGSEAAIKAMTGGAYTNTSDVLICAEGGVQVICVLGGNADILAEAVEAYSNTASVGIAAKGDEGVEVRAENGRAYIESRAFGGYESTAETIVCTEGGVQVVDKSLVVASAGIIAEAFDGYHSDAYVGVRAEDDILVMAGIGPEDLVDGINGGTGGHAEIRAAALSYVYEYDKDDPPTANAETVVYSINGGVAVIDAKPVDEPQPRTAEIISLANGGYTNTAYTGVYAGGDLFNEEFPAYEEGLGVFVVGFGDGSHARILSETHGDYVNTSNTVVCTPAMVMVASESESGVAEIGACAMGDGFNAATTQVYASDVHVYRANLHGDGGIWANAFGWPVVPFVEQEVFILSEYNGEYGNKDLVWVEGGGEVDDDISTLKIRGYSKRQDCPEAPKCPCEEPIGPKPVPAVEPAAQPFVPAAPIPELIVLEISGYPALLGWVARELGVDEGSIEIGVANSLASSKGIQPYNSFSRLRKAAAILRDAGGVYINAMAQVISEYASSTVPPTEEQMAAIANVISRNVGANNQYALAGQYLDALAEYVSILRDEMGFSADEAVRLATDNYIQNLTEGQTGVAAFMAARLSSLAGS